MRWAEGWQLGRLIVITYLSLRFDLGVFLFKQQCLAVLS